MTLPAELTRTASAIAARLVARGETVAVAESSSGGLVSAALLSVPGASAFYVGGTVIYTATAYKALMSGAVDRPAGMRGASEDYARHLAAAAASRLGTVWGVSETGATGPTGNPYGDPAGHSWVAVHGPDGHAARNVLTGTDDREANMVAFAAAALVLLLDSIPDG